MVNGRSIREHGFMDPANRRFGLLIRVMNAESLRGGGRRARRRMFRLCRGESDHVARRREGDLDRDWVIRELLKVKADPGEYPEESYERWRLHGMPIWAAIAAGMTPTPGSRKLIGRRPNLP